MASDFSASLRIKTVTGQRPERFEECSNHYFSVFVELFMAILMLVLSCEAFKTIFSSDSSLVVPMRSTRITALTNFFVLRNSK